MSGPICRFPPRKLVSPRPQSGGRDRVGHHQRFSVVADQIEVVFQRRGRDVHEVGDEAEPQPIAQKQRRWMMLSWRCMPVIGQPLPR
jgi:hypothetical protein